MCVSISVDVNACLLGIMMGINWSKRVCVCVNGVGGGIVMMRTSGRICTTRRPIKLFTPQKKSIFGLLKHTPHNAP